MKSVRAIVTTLCALVLASMMYALARRAAYPYDLEWMEGGMLCHALRIARGQPLYGPPSVDFIPFLYTPFYPWLLAKLGGVSGIGYLLGRAVSLVSLAGALLLSYVYGRRAGGSRAMALVAPAMMAAAFVPTGAWYDLARPDTLFLFLVTAGLLCGFWGRRRPVALVVSALLLVLAFFTKQTASPFMVGLGLVLLIVSWRAALLWGVTLALVGLPALYLANRSTDGWFWTYVFALHQGHDFYPLRAFVGSPLRLVLLLGPALLLVPWALWRRRSPELIFATALGAVGIATACLGFGTQWAFTNAFIPGVFFPAIAIATAAGRLTRELEAARPPRLRPWVVLLLVIGSLVTSTGVALPWATRRFPKSIGLPADEPTAFALEAFLPTAKDREAGDALVRKLAATPGEVLVPYHPFYAQLAGKRSYLHRMGVMDVERAGLGVPRGLAEAIAERRFSLVVMDEHFLPFQWPGLFQHYRAAGFQAGPRSFSGAQTRPRDLFEPIAVPVVEHPPVDLP